MAVRNHGSADVSTYMKPMGRTRLALVDYRTQNAATVVTVTGYQTAQSEYWAGQR
jgi:hypothetical protein